MPKILHQIFELSIALKFKHCYSIYSKAHVNPTFTNIVRDLMKFINKIVFNPLNDNNDASHANQN